MNPDNGTNGFPPLQLKGEIMDLEFTIDTDHRCASPPPLFSPAKMLNGRRAFKETPAEPDDAELSQLPHLQAEGRYNHSAARLDNDCALGSATENAPVSDASSSAW